MPDDCGLLLPPSIFPELDEVVWSKVIVGRILNDLLRRGSFALLLFTRFIRVVLILAVKELFMPIADEDLIQRLEECRPILVQVSLGIHLLSARVLVKRLFGGISALFLICIFFRFHELN